MGVTNSENVGVAMGLVIGAGAATGLGASVVFFPSLVRLASRKTLAGALGLSAGVMTYVSFAEIFIKSQDSFEDSGFDEDDSKIYSTLCFFAGVVTMVALNALVTYLLGGHHHHHHAHGRTHTTNSREESGDDDDDDDDDDDEDSESSEPVAPCPCHDDSPIDTLEKVKGMAESMAVHPDRPHPQGYTHHHPKLIEHQKQVAEAQEAGAVPTNAEGHHEQGDAQNSAGQEIPHNPESETSESKHDVEGFSEEETTPRRVSEVKQVEDEPSDFGDDEDDDDEEEEDDAERNRKLVRMSLNTALAIGLHNFPEGLATFVAALDDPKVGAVLAIAIAIHNIPEGLCVAMPIYYATGNKWKAFGWALLSGLAEPIAGLLGWLILAQSFSDQLYALLFGMVAGMMVIISIRELLPTAHRYDPEDSVVTYSFIVGMGIMALSLLLFML